MKRWYCAVVLIAALLCVGAVGAAKPVKEPVDKVVFVHYKDGYVRPAPGAPADSTATFKLMGMKWTQRQIPFSVNPATPNLPASTVVEQVGLAFGEWDGHTSASLFNPVLVTSTAPATGRNDVYFAPMGPANRNVIAMTTVWYNRATKQITEADIQMNADLPWGIDADGELPGDTLANAYDVRNIATHEIGHVCGLADLYTARTADLTMYGYGGLGEVKKDSLGDGDIAGVRKLYGR